MALVNFGGHAGLQPSRWRRERLEPDDCTIDQERHCRCSMVSRRIQWSKSTFVQLHISSYDWRLETRMVQCNTRQHCTAISVWYVMKLVCVGFCHMFYMTNLHVYIYTRSGVFFIFFLNILAWRKVWDAMLFFHWSWGVLTAFLYF